MSTVCSHQAGRVLVLVLLLAGTVPAGAQVVRGRITEQRSGAPVSGVLVSLLSDPSGETLASVLSSREGDYAVRAPAPGRYRLAAKRIGVRRFESAAFTLGEGETRRIDVTVDAIAMSLPEVTVSGLCVTNQRDVGRVASLWDEVRTALTATAVSQRDQLARAAIVRYAAELDPGSLRPLFEWRSNVELTTDSPFTSRSGDSLSLLGYWRVLHGDSVEFQAPDAAALASNAFVRDHCFALGRRSADRPGQVALEFVPARDRDLADIMGTIWISERTFELQVVEFRYTRLPRSSDAQHLGGEVHFQRLPGGAWIVDRWFIRMPQEVVRSDDWPRRQLREEGGVVIADSQPVVATATVTGLVRDRNGTPFPGANVHALGTSRQAITAADGSYRLDGMPAGDVSLVVRWSEYDAMGVLAGSQRLRVRAGQSARVDFRAPDDGALIREFCADSRAARTRGVLRLLVTDSASARPVPGVTLHLTWQAAPGRRGVVVDRAQTVSTDARGAASLCYLPAYVPINVMLSTPAGSQVPVLTVSLEPNRVVARVVTVRMGR
jgi:hypothetical protein